MFRIENNPIHPLLCPTGLHALLSIPSHTSQTRFEHTHPALPQFKGIMKSVALFSFECEPSTRRDTNFEEKRMTVGDQLPIPEGVISEEDLPSTCALALRERGSRSTSHPTQFRPIPPRIYTKKMTPKKTFPASISQKKKIQTVEDPLY